MIIYNRVIAGLALLFIWCFVVGVSSSHALNIGDEAPNFTLQSADGKQVSLKDYRDKVVVLEWFNPGCPFVRKHYDSGAMQKLQTEAAEKGVVWLNINSTASGRPDFLTPEKTKGYVAEKGVKAAAMLSDADGTVGKKYGASATPHMYVIDKAGKLVYQGAIDDNPDVSGDPATAKNYVRDAMGSLLSGKQVAVAETKAYGCSVKYAS